MGVMLTDLIPIDFEGVRLSLQDESQLFSDPIIKMSWKGRKYFPDQYLYVKYQRMCRFALPEDYIFSGVTIWLNVYS